MVDTWVLVTTGPTTYRPVLQMASPFHSIFHSTVVFHIPVHELETPLKCIIQLLALYGLPGLWCHACIYIIVSHSSALQCFTVSWVITKLYVLRYPVAIHKTITKILDEILCHFWLDKMHGIEQNRNGSKFTFTAHVFHAGFVCNSYWLQAEFWFIDT